MHAVNLRNMLGASCRTQREEQGDGTEFIINERIAIIYRHRCARQPLVTTTNLSNLSDLRLQLVEGNGSCNVEQSQHLRVNIINSTARSMNLALSFNHQFSKKERFIWIGVISGNIGKLDAHQLTEIHLNLVPLTSGLKKIGGVKLTESYMRHTYELEEFHTLLVLPKFANEILFKTTAISDSSCEISSVL
ncbi:unnamed protein product [Didymodactylos carnosus]|uniref:Trafficking protein particle complex subunit 13 C-terminal domain-containing protein n=1 Tax=Didymodactylos carnosus TaxID=1234261 RepID=A0A8S2IQL7_9BILA|nr:unnamed protein product [Didymodactylos carnosus]CAF3772393.1 unnamed protein product [Didymodactylos carnosus]